MSIYENLLLQHKEITWLLETNIDEEACISLVTKMIDIESDLEEIERSL